MRPINAARTGLLALGLLAAGAATGAETRVYDITVAGLPLGAVTLAAEQTGDSYVAQSRITPNGLVAAFTSYSFDGRASGRIVDGKVEPKRFVADSSSPRAKRRTEVEWNGPRPVKVSVVPPRKFQPDPERVYGALDPVSAGFALLRDKAPGEVCNAEVEVFDGSRRSKLTVGKPAAVEGGLVCRGTYARIEGEAHSISETQASYPFTLTFVPAAGGQVTLDRIETQTRFGTAVISRRG